MRRGGGVNEEERVLIKRGGNVKMRRDENMNDEGGEYKRG